MVKLGTPGNRIDQPVVDEPLDLNTASRKQLRAIPGIGDGRADQFLAWRDRQGRFETVDDLQHLPLFTAEVVRQVRSHLKV